MAYTRPQSFNDNDPATPITAGALHDMQDSVYNQAASYADSTAVQAATANAVALHAKRDLGAVGNGTTDDRAAIQAGITLLGNTGTGGVIFFPAGLYLIGSPGLVWPNNSTRAITLLGAGMGGTSVNSQTTRFIRNGAYTMISASGTGTGGGQQCHGVTVRDLTLDGSAQNATVCNLVACATTMMTRVRIKNSPGIGINAPQHWNCHYTDCHFEELGTFAADRAAVLMTDVNGGASNTNTVQFANCLWEGNTGTDLKLAGGTVSAGVIVTGSKFERGAGYAVHFGNAEKCMVTGAYIYSDKTPAMIRHDGGSANGVVSCGFESNSAPHIQLMGGSRVTVTGNAFGPSAQTHITIGSGFGEPAIIGNTHVAGANLFINDQRGTKSGLIGQNGQVRAYDGLTTKVTAGPPTDASFAKTPVDGTIAVDSTNGRLYFRYAGTWHYCAQTA